MKRYITKYGTPYAADVKRLANGSYRDIDTKTTFAARHVKEWDELSDEQKRLCICGMCDSAIESIRYGCAKDATLSDLEQRWIADAERKRDELLVNLSEP